mgnify:CR=1 FL=1|tara:strand:- start:2537 stop:3280 length:744 start_codon:yes stop_codon:yes gene_type:complete
MCETDILGKVSNLNVYGTLTGDTLKLRHSNGWNIAATVQRGTKPLHLNSTLYVRLSKPSVVSPKSQKLRQCVQITALQTFAGDAQTVGDGTTLFQSVTENALVYADTCSGDIFIVHNDGKDYQVYNPDDIACIVLQRTAGGMKLFDMHVLSHSGDGILINNVSHSQLHACRTCFGKLVHDAGADPVTPVFTGDSGWEIDGAGGYVSSGDCDSDYDPEQPEQESESDVAWSTESESMCDSEEEHWNDH